MISSLFKKIEASPRIYLDMEWETVYLEGRNKILRGFYDNPIQFSVGHYFITMGIYANITKYIVEENYEEDNFVENEETDISVENIEIYDEKYEGELKLTKSEEDIFIYMILSRLEWD